jgi:predicted ATPase
MLRRHFFLRSLTLQGFRSCPDPTRLAFAPLTILAGANNTGKSSFVGALLALVQSAQAGSRDQLHLNGHWVDLGPFDELLSPDCETFSFGVEGSVLERELSVAWEFGEASEEVRRRAIARVVSMTATLDDEPIIDLRPGKVRGFGTVLLSPTEFLRLPNRRQLCFPYEPSDVHAVGPYRMPPTEFSAYRVGSDGSLVGRYGQHATEAFWSRRDYPESISPPPSSRAGIHLSEAMDAWWRYVLADAEVAVRVEEVARLGYAVRLSTRSIANRSFGQVGFGLSQLWPILVAGLTSGPGDLVIVETPEAHLHPGAQHRISNLFVELARAGRQVVVETHSEHVVAAACLAVKRGLLKPEDVAITFFTQPGGITQLQRIDVDPNGRRLDAPEGFFDQSSRELLDLLGDP